MTNQAPESAVDRTRLMDSVHLAEQIERDAVALKGDGGLDVTNEESQLGRRLFLFEVQARLLVLNPNLYFEKSKADPTKWGIYIRRPGPDPSTGKGINHRVFLCGMEAGVSPEFSVIEAEEEKFPHPTEKEEWIRKLTPKAEKARGWRTILVRLIKQGVISKARAEQHFEVHLGRSSEKWQGAVN
jgi:hypothetical protein